MGTRWGPIHAHDVAGSASSAEQRGDHRHACLYLPYTGHSRLASSPYMYGGVRVACCSSELRADLLITTCQECLCSSKTTCMGHPAGLTEFALLLLPGEPVLPFPNELSHAMPPISLPMLSPVYMPCSNTSIIVSRR